METPSTAVSLRPATRADQWDIYRLIVSNNLNPLDLDWRRFTVAVDQTDRVVGCGQIRRHGVLDELASLAVAKAWQGRGVSRLLMQNLLERGRRPLWLVCESHLLALYARYGFAEVTAPEALPGYFRMSYWPMRLTLGAMLTMRGTYIAYMVLPDPGSCSDSDRP